MTPFIAIIVPILNEADNLPELQAQLQPFYDRGAEIVLVDGGSGDDSRAIAGKTHFKLLEAPRGRALQMNAGAAVCRADCLLFLHADTRLPDNADELIARALENGHLWGRFDVRIEGRHPMLALIARMMNLRSRLTGIATGDQALFIDTTTFRRIGGFPEQALMEDIEISRRLKRFCKPACLREQVVTSGRRWEQHGVWRTMLLMWRLRLAYWLGVPAAKLAERYR